MSSKMHLQFQTPITRFFNTLANNQSFSFSYLDVLEHLGELHIKKNGDITASLQPNFSGYDEYYLWTIFCHCVKKGWFSTDTTRIRLVLSADAPFPYQIREVMKSSTFKTLNLNQLRATFPRELWSLCFAFAILDGHIHWKHTIIVAPKYQSLLQYHRLKALGVAAQNGDQRLEALHHLYVWNQGLKKLPKEIGYLPNLKRLEIWGNPVTEIPPSFANLTSLQVIVLSNNQKNLLPQLRHYLPDVTIGWSH